MPSAGSELPRGSYAFTAKKPGAVDGAAHALRLYGFCGDPATHHPPPPSEPPSRAGGPPSNLADRMRRCSPAVLDGVIPSADVRALNDELLAATAAPKPSALRGESIGFGRWDDDGGDGGLGSREQFERWLRPGRATRGLRPVHDIVGLPLLAPHLAEPAVVGVARAALDEHVRIAQMHPRVLRTSGFGGTRGTPDAREWHTDWPHDLPGYSGDDPRRTSGAIRQPFPDVCMALTMVWMLDDVDEESGGGTVCRPRRSQGHAQPARRG